MEHKKNYALAIAISDGDDQFYRDKVAKENGLDDETKSRLNFAHLFRLSDNMQYTQFDADIVMFDEEKETYWHTGDFEPIATVEKNEVVALVDENGECEMI